MLALPRLTADRAGALLFLTFIVLFLALNPLGERHFFAPSDEGYYRHYAQEILDHGVKGFRDLVEWYTGSLEARSHPAPIRFGYQFLVASLFKVFGASFTIMGNVATVAFFLLLALNFYFLRKHLSYEHALASIILLASSPLFLNLSRRALIDVPVALFWTWTLWLVYEIVEHGPALKRSALLLLVMWAALSVKESALIVAAAICLFAVIGKFFHYVRSLRSIFIPVLGAVLLYLLSLLLLLGDLDRFILGFTAVFFTHASLSSHSSYAINYCSGPWFRYLLDFLLLVPVEVILACGFVFYILLQRPINRLYIYWIAMFTIIYALFNTMPHSKILRQVATLEVPLAMFAAGAVFLLFERLKTKGGRLYFRPLIIIMIMGIMNWSYFIKIFYVTFLEDPISQQLLFIHRLIPG
jgi:4-amino-4-deoxy-L-arabinose transferase-like glycosyltransferase